MYFVLGSKKTDFSPEAENEERAFRIEGDDLGGEVRGVEDDGGFAVRIEAKYFRGRAARGVERAFGIDADGPQIRGIRVGEQREFWRELEAAIASHCHATGGALEELFVSGLAPAAGVLGKKR